MFYLFHKKNVFPSQVKQISRGEKEVLKAFMYRELEIEEKKNKID
jgi:hypothetical protein